MYLRHARPSGIEKVVIVQTGYHQFDNSYATDAIKRFPGVFSVIGIVDETKENVQDDMEALKAQFVIEAAIKSWQTGQVVSVERP